MKPFLAITLIIILTIILQGCGSRYNMKSNKVYYIVDVFEGGHKEHKIKEANAATFKILNREYGKDMNQAYFKQHSIVGSDPHTFVVLNGGYSKDKNAAYFTQYPIINSDSHTFIVLKGGYSKDKNAVYFYGEKIEKADSKSFKLTPHSYYGRDANDYYFKTYSMQVSDMESFEFLADEIHSKIEGYVAKDRYHFYEQSFQGDILVIKKTPAN